MLTVLNGRHTVRSVRRQRDGQVAFSLPASLEEPRVALQDLPYVLAGQGGAAGLNWEVGPADVLLQHMAAGGAEVQLVPGSRRPYGCVAPRVTCPV